MLKGSTKFVLICLALLNLLVFSPRLKTCVYLAKYCLGKINLHILSSKSHTFIPVANVLGKTFYGRPSDKKDL